MNLDGRWEVVRECRQSFVDGLLAATRPFARVLPPYLRWMGISAMMELVGVGLIAIGSQWAAPGASIFRMLGEGVMFLGAVLGMIASLRAVIDLCRESGFPKRNR